MIKKMMKKSAWVVCGIVGVVTMFSYTPKTIPAIRYEDEMGKEEMLLEKILEKEEVYPKALVELARTKAETREFVYDYLSEETAFAEKKITIQEDYEEGEYPLFLQWDKRWGYHTYGDNYMAINGCGPTTLAMVIVGLTGDTTINPMEVATFSYESGYYVKNVGTSWELMTKGARAFGVNGEELPLSERHIKNSLANDKPIIASMGPGNFTSAGHFVLLTGITEDGKIIVNDSDSKIRSNQVWDVEVFLNQAKNLWHFWK
ncbi:MAG: C39 family peptidase [Cellulosilyticaceae bacterium]